MCLTPPFNGNLTAHEMGHGFGMHHDVGPGLTTVSDYSDPARIMSQNGSFLQAPWNVGFGPAVCVPHMVQQNWLPPGRLFVDDDGTWMRRNRLPLAPLSHLGARANPGSPSQAGAELTLSLRHFATTLRLVTSSVGSGHVVDEKPCFLGKKDLCTGRARSSRLRACGSLRDHARGPRTQGTVQERLRLGGGVHGSWARRDVDHERRRMTVRSMGCSSADKRASYRIRNRARTERAAR